MPCLDVPRVSESDRPRVFILKHDHYKRTMRYPCNTQNLQTYLKLCNIDLHEMTGRGEGRKVWRQNIGLKVGVHFYYADTKKMGFSLESSKPKVQKSQFGIHPLVLASWPLVKFRTISAITSRFSGPPNLHCIQCDSICK